MPDAKYGRLFTEADVLAIVQYALIQGHRLPHVQADSPLRSEELLAWIDDADGSPGFGRWLTFPADEPLFVLRGQDAYALFGIAEYGRRLDNPIAPRVAPKAEFVDAVAAAGAEIMHWQHEHRDRVKVPD